MEEQHNEPEKPMVYEPPDLEGRRHVAKGKLDCLTLMKNHH